MEFWNRTPLHQKFLKSPEGAGVRIDDADSWYEVAIKNTSKHLTALRSDPRSEGTTALSMLVADKRWVARGKPYYNVWPKVIEPLSKVDLTQVPAAEAAYPISPILLRFPIGTDAFPVKGYGLRHAMVMQGSIDIERMRRFYGDSHLPDDLSLLPTSKSRPMMQLQMVWAHENGDSQAYIETYLTDEGSIEDGIQSIASFDREMFGGFGDLDHIQYSVIRLAATIAMIARHPDREIIQPDILAADREKWRATYDEKYAERAKKRGKFGWEVGREFTEARSESAPHWRNSHFCLFHTGPGRTKHEVKLRQGGVIRRKIVGKVPTGYLADEEAAEAAEAAAAECD